ncbi:phenylalanine--tRNA ligase subunit beta [candidate division WWE3 bacterium RIFCSPHIGHO2_01_FULL_40_23]|uniref:phenylalanine--tRNA ligase n=1 Tax=candidate division WWE3 bacterium RIFCSPLOWO2_01_FULL_41_18 TaxID=1802625 RepID=A0A1F4VDY7_UNCKA|nr:MAG: phenylalanine--tRNA ligase subunit beta [candidate division WWE3 bacterium RIFCSPHIGHO2_01_FULL_40_23]OGC55384.1 MAG: phenylalanine--tRNA ligase subunit beta [candidate division WWE3 bacterium RIFCSPLOWO2_01_FULL_41_18]
MRIPFGWLKQYVDVYLTPKDVANSLTLIGHALDKPIFSQEGDFVMDFEDRGNRADVSGVIGIARDLAAVTEEKLKLPKLSEIPETNNKLFQPAIKVESDKVLRWRAVVFKGIKVEPSPDWMQKRLKSYGIEVINNIVDITNYVMIEFGMPLHAFDLDKVNEIILRSAKRGETMVTFEGTKLSLDENDLIAADKTKPLTLTTAVGGAESGISISTKNVLIEAGLYHQATARRSAIKHNVRNETSNRLGKYLHPHYCEIAIARAIQLMKEVTGTDCEEVSFDYYPKKEDSLILKLTKERLNLISGEDIPLKTAGKHLEDLGFLINGMDDKNLIVSVPYFRTDVVSEDDLIEEVLRIKGYDTIPSYLPQKPAPTKLHFPEMELEDEIRDILSKLEFNEIASEQIIDIEELRKIGFLLEESTLRGEHLVKLENSWNKELNILRPTLLLNFIKYLSSYLKQGVGDIKLFECGKVYKVNPNKKGYEKYLEVRKVGIMVNSDFLTLKSRLETFLLELGIKNISYEKEENFLSKSQKSAVLIYDEQTLGRVGELKQKVVGEFGINEVISYCELDLRTILEFTTDNFSGEVKTSLENLVSEDFTFTVDEHFEVGKLVNELQQVLDITTSIIFVGVYKDEKLKKDKKKSVTFNFKFQIDKSNWESKKVKRLWDSYSHSA